MKTNRRVCVGIALWVITSLAQVLWGQASPVGERSNPDHWEFIGVISFDPPVIANALASDLKLADAERTAATAEEYETLLGAQLTEAYRHAGFPDVAVQVVSPDDSQRLQIHINEGPRYEMRECRVTGLDDAQSQTLKQFLMSTAYAATPTPIRDRLTLTEEQRKDRSEPFSDGPGIWAPGFPASFTDFNQAIFRRRVTQFLLDEGYSRPVFELRYDRQESYADLLVDVQGLGPQTTFRSVRFVGNQRNSDDEILAVLGLEFPLVWTARTQEQIYRRLWETGRFASISVESRSRFTKELVVTLSELPEIPSLSSPLSPQGELALRVPTHDHTTRASDEVLVSIELKDRRAVLQSSPQRFYIQWQGTHPGEQGEILAKPDEITVVDVSRRRKFTLPFSIGQMVLGVYMTIDPQAQDSPYRAQVRAGIRSRAASTAAIGEVQMHCDPAWALGITYDPESKTEELEDCYVFSTERSSVFLCKNPPEIREFRSHSNLKTGEAASYSIQRVHGLLAEKQRELLDRIVGFEECHVAQAPLSSLLRFLLQSSWNERWREVVELTDNQRQQLRMSQDFLLSLVNARIFSSLDEWIVDHKKQKESPWNRLTIGYTESGSSFSGGTNPYLLWSHVVFERESWPWLLSREWALAQSGLGPVTSRSVAEILDAHDCGPIGHYFLTRALPAQESFRLSRQAIAERGMLPTTQARLRNDYDQLLSRADRPLEFLRQRIQQMSPQEVDLLATSLEDDRGILQELHRSGPLQKGEHIQDRFWPLAEHAWERWGTWIVRSYYYEQFPDLREAAR